MDFEVSRELVTTLVPALELHNGIGLLIVAVFMYLRSDSVLKLFGVGIGLLGLGQLTTAALLWLQPADDVQMLFAILGSVVSTIAVIAFVVVGSSDYSRLWRWVAIVGIVVWAVILFTLEPLFDTGNAREYTEAGYVFRELHAFTMVWFMLGWFIAFLHAVHIAVEHSHGEPYRSILVAAMSIFAVSVMVIVIAGADDELRFLSSVVNSAMVLVMWVAVVLHERREIAAEHRNGVEQPA